VDATGEVNDCTEFERAEVDRPDEPHPNEKRCYEPTHVRIVPPRCSRVKVRHRLDL